MKCIINRRAQFSAIHQDWLPELTDIKNREKFGLHRHTRVHSHNYILFVFLESYINDYGMGQNLSEVKQVIAEQVTNQLDHTKLNEVWLEFQQTPPTIENLARVIWQRLSKHLPLVKIQLFAYSELWAEYQGKGMEAYLTISTHFSAAHRLALSHLSYEKNLEIYGKCARINGHGHNYHLEVTVKGNIAPLTGMIVDLRALNQVVEDYVVEVFDHTFLNKDILYFTQVVPTTENFAVYILGLLQQPISQLGVQLHKVKLIESQNNAAEVYASSVGNESTLIEPVIPAFSPA